MAKKYAWILKYNKIIKDNDQRVPSRDCTIKALNLGENSLSEI